MRTMNSEYDNSQQSQSSSNDSIISRLSGRNAAAKDDLRSDSRNERARETTPSTSVSEASSQEPSGSTSSLLQGPVNHSPKNAPGSGSISPPIGNNKASQPISMQDNLQNAVQPPKRTASGEIKRPGQNQQSSHDAASQYSHSRNTSTASRSSHISDMSNDLCTRLSYAMFKVQNGFQSHSLDQIEAMHLQKTTSPNGTPALYSPSSTIPTTGSSYSPGKRHSTQRLPLDRLPQVYQPQQLDGTLRSPRPHSSRLMDSPWQNLPATSTIETARSHQLQHQGPTLAPPADIQPRNPRRSQINGVQQPRLDTRRIHGAAVTPSTPPQRPAPNTQTPNAKSAEEQDAVETLMFMSSPGNSGYHPAFHTPMSPPSNRATTDPRHISPAKLSTTADINRVLDQMSRDDSSSDEDSSFP